MVLYFFCFSQNAHFVYVFIRTDFAGHTFPGPSMPSGMVQPGHDSIIGNDDCGQLSAWHILSSLGFYPVNPASGEFVLGAPQMEKAIIYLPMERILQLKPKILPPEIFTLTNHLLHISNLWMGEH